MKNRIYHPWWKWECYKAGFYETTPPLGMTKEQALEAYKVFLQDLNAFNAAMERLQTEWPNSCDQFLTNPNINRIAWLGQAAMCLTHGVPSCFRAGFKLLSNEEQTAANTCAENFLKKWELCKQSHAS